MISYVHCANAVKTKETMKIISILNMISLTVYICPFFADSVLKELGCSFQGSLNVPDPTRAMISTSRRRERRGSPPKQGKKENVYLKFFVYMSCSSFCHRCLDTFSFVGLARKFFPLFPLLFGSQYSEGSKNVFRL